MQGDGADRSERVRLRGVRALRFFPSATLLGGCGVHEPVRMEQPALPEATLSQSSDENCSIFFFTITDFFFFGGGGGNKSKSAPKILGNFFDLTDLGGGESTEV